MPFRRETAAMTLRNALNVLADLWQQVDEASRDRLEQLIRQAAPPVFTSSRLDVVNRIVAFLEPLWDARGDLPQPVVEALAAGQGISQSAITSVDAEAIAGLEQAMLRITDPRFYRDPGQLAVQISALVAANSGRLAADERRIWEQLDQQYRASGDAEKYLRAVERLLGGYPAVAGLLNQGKVWDRFRSFSAVTSLARPPSAATAAADAPDTAAGAEFERHANVHFPAAVLATQRSVPLIVHIAAEYQEGGAVGEAASRVALRAGDLTILAHAEGFDVAGAIGGRAVPGVVAARVVTAAADRDCEPVIFFLNPRSPGTRRVSVDIYQFDRNIATLAFETQVVAQVEADGLRNVEVEQVPVVSPGPSARPPDLELRVMLLGDRRTLVYMLHSPGTSDYHFWPAGTKTLNDDPRDILQRYTDRLSRLARLAPGARSPQVTQNALQEMADIGASLYDELVSDKLKQEYPRIRRNYAGKSLLVTSDEPWIPWELVRPVEYDPDGNELYNDPFLCEMFQVSRWLAGRGAPDSLALQAGVVVAPSDNLSYTEQEEEFFTELHRRHWEIRIEGPLTTASEVRQCFTNKNIQLYHFACHGNFDATNPDESLLKLEDDALRPSQLTSARGTLRQARPLVFLNACHAGRVGFSLTGLGGWAEKFLDAGAGGFIGTLWEINDQLAAQFACDFYNCLWGMAGYPAMPLGEAFYRARLAIKQSDPANPTWLAYVLYGDPWSVVTLGTGPAR